MSGLQVAFSFLTRVPARVDAVYPERLRSATPWFPVVGAFVGLVVGGVYAIGFEFLPSQLAATIAITVGILVTGGFHEDGLADTADALGSGTDRERALEIMKDPRVGAFGAIALGISLLWRVVALASMGPAVGAAALVLAHTLSRVGSVVLMGLIPPARKDGLARQLATGGGLSAIVVAVGIGAGLGVALTGIWVVPSILAVALVVAWLARASKTRLGGVTGDVMGACQQVGEMAVITVGAALAWRGSTLWWL